MAAPPPPLRDDSDSEDDDYVPPVEDDSESSDDESPEAKRVKLNEPESEEEQARKKRDREALWADFQASVSNSTAIKVEEPPKKLVKVEKRYLFAGKEVVEILQVPEDSADAKKWPLWSPPNDVTSRPTTESTDASMCDREDPGIAIIAASVPASSSPSSPSATLPPKRPGPRKRTTLAGLPTPGAQKAKKLTTLDKSAMDWRTHVNSELGTGMKDELEANRRGGGYLEKVEFLRRVENRKEDALEASKSTKRRRV
ncbi:hypothetical protein SERLA73DRAFT_149756 [Serpula lacrymans var. lacrymans S7.3]|uniref:SWR1-complex protein 5 n=1 Tax=Serpula lacrymans var. lacrymans (strain S7.3) TaxID=936435 RepID=F8PJP7_SERL3|nr:hypothetical protein SERLA73DRAFT_149756 [Serpula lacrymans var. lacrymans S7.3]